MLRSLLPLLIAASLAAQTPSAGVLKQAAQEMVDARAKFTQEVVDSIFSFSELGYQETETSAYVTG
ncbi:MAG: amidohydrolase, partial [Bryobacterales bacterium]|nr:amidohydrolase [Bryobacterales bacterium]